MKTNVIPDCVDLGVDVRTLPGEHHDDVTAHLRAALGDLYDKVEIEVIMDDPASISRVDNPLWDSLERALTKPFPSGRPTPQLEVGFTDAIPSDFDGIFSRAASSSSSSIRHAPSSSENSV